jgi:thiamine pyrophosphokinase
VEARQLAQALALAPEAVGADGGGKHALPEGHAFRAVIGDMDSLRDPARLRAAGVAILEVGEQDSTDLEKCLYSVEAPLFIGLGFLGGRIDHHLAAMNGVVRHAARRVVLIGGADLCCVCPPDFAIELAAGTRVSLFPMGAVTGMVSEGLRWPVTGLAFAPDARIGTSNIATGGRVRLAFDAPRMLVILPAAQLGRVVDRWP